MTIKCCVPYGSIWFHRDNDVIICENRILINWVSLRSVGKRPINGGLFAWKLIYVDCGIFRLPCLMSGQDTAGKPWVQSSRHCNPLHTEILRLLWMQTMTSNASEAKTFPCRSWEARGTSSFLGDIWRLDETDDSESRHIQHDTAPMGIKEFVYRVFRKHKQSWSSSFMIMLTHDSGFHDQ